MAPSGVGPFQNHLMVILLFQTAQSRVSNWDSLMPEPTKALRLLRRLLLSYTPPTSLMLLFLSHPAKDLKRDRHPSSLPVPHLPQLAAYKSPQQKPSPWDRNLIWPELSLFSFPGGGLGPLDGFGMSAGPQVSPGLSLFGSGEALSQLTHHSGLDLGGGG